MTRILIGYNGSEAATAALHDLQYAGLPDTTEALILTVADPWITPKTDDEAENIAAAGKAAIRKDFPTWTVTAQTAAGSPPREVLARAERFKPDLIVIGEPRQERGPGDMFIGHTSHTILTEASCSVRIGRGSGGLTLHPERVLIGFDGSAGAARAVDAIAARCWPANTEVRLLFVADPSVLGSIGRFTPQMTTAAVETKFASQWAETLAAASAENLKRAGIYSSVEVRLGHAKDVIVESAREWHADTIFVGPHCALNSFERYMLGSVSAAVAARAHCSVEVVRSLS